MKRAIAIVLVAMSGTGCAALSEVAALRDVDFAIAGVREGMLAGVDLSRLQDLDDLRAADLLTVIQAVNRGELPFRFTLRVAADNPAANPTARLVRLDWQLLLAERETVSGVLDREVALPPGEVTEIPLRVELDLLRFFREDAGALVDLALSALGRGGEPTSVKLVARPTVQTPLGPVRYPEPITIAARGFGGTQR